MIHWYVALGAGFGGLIAGMALGYWWLMKILPHILDLDNLSDSEDIRPGRGSDLEC